MNILSSQLLGSGPVMPSAAARISPSTRFAIGLMGLVLIASLSYIAVQLAQDPERFPVKNVDVFGTLDYEDRELLMDTVKSFTGEGFYGLDIDHVRQAVEELPWISHARVSRVWPARIEVRVEEHEPAARWNEDSLISKRLQLFKPPQLQEDSPNHAKWKAVFAELPQLQGSPGRHSVLLDTFRDYSQRLASKGARLDLMTEDDRRSQTLELSGQVTVRLGVEDRTLRMDRFLDVYDRLVKEQTGSTGAQDTPARGPLTFDMRYSNGFALSGMTEKRLGNNASVLSNTIVLGQLQ